MEKILGGVGKSVIASSVIPVLLLLPGQLEYLYVFDHVLTGAERRTSQATPSQSWPPPRAVPRTSPDIPGLPRRPKQAVDQQFARGVMLHVQSNPLPICIRARMLIEGKRT